MLFTRAAPVVVVRIVAAGPVALGPEFFDEDVGTPALEGAGARFDTTDGVGAGDGGFGGVPDGGVVVFGAGGPDCGGCEEGCAGGCEFLGGDGMGWEG